MANEANTVHLYQVIFKVDPFSIPRLCRLIPNELGQLAFEDYYQVLSQTPPPPGARTPEPQLLSRRSSKSAL